MTNPQSWSSRRTRLLNRIEARLSTRARACTAFVSMPEPRAIGNFARGRQLVAGNYLFAGHLVEGRGVSVWDIQPPDRGFSEELHGFAWLDDLAAVGDAPARELAAAWLWGWIDRYGRGNGPGWTPDLTGRRLIRWINHAIFLLRAQDPARHDAFHRLLAQQTKFLSKRWHATAPGLPRFEALTGLIFAGMALEGQEARAEPAIKALARETEAQVDAQGGLPTRNPEELLGVFTLLTWAASALSSAGRQVPRAQLEAIERIAPSLRTLRHADGSLARFHGGGRGTDGWLDHALAASGVKTAAPDGLSMGYARLSGGRTSVVIDASPPPIGKASHNAHASTLAFELTSGRRPLIVNCGSGTRFGADWGRAGRATPSHSTLSIEGYSSARLGNADQVSAREALVDAPRNVPIEISEMSDGMRFEGGHDGYVATHGLTHARILDLTFDGRAMAGEDMLLALDDPAKRQFNKAMDSTKLQGIDFDIRFHLHPEVEAMLDMAGTAVSMLLKSGEVWVFRSEGVELRLEPSVYLERGRLKPRGAQQIVLSGTATDYATTRRWSLSKAQETAIGVRDLVMDETPL